MKIITTVLAKILGYVYLSRVTWFLNIDKGDTKRAVGFLMSKGFNIIQAMQMVTNVNKMIEAQKAKKVASA